MKIRDVMSSLVQWIDAYTSIREVAEAMAEAKMPYLTVRGGANGDTIGVVTGEDISGITDWTLRLRRCFIYSGVLLRG